ncbi:MAG TPA: sugar phosphate nucleotidyltransferase [Armatimonadota bacterium]|jgi:UTP--glucose-1-phosphate uridylyltransferase
MFSRTDSIRKAVIPAAGYGTRLRPLTRITAKELLPLGRKPTVEYVVEELHSVGVDCIIFVISPHKTSIREYFGDSACEGKVAIKYVLQETQRGLADAILCAEKAVDGEDFIVALGDTVIASETPSAALERVLSAYRSNPAFASIVVERVPVQESSRYGMVRPVGDSTGEHFEVDLLVEKPAVGCSPSDFAIGGRYIFNSGIFELIRRTSPGAGGEQQITDSIGLAISEGHRVWCVPVVEGERRYDIGNIVTYCEAFTAMCMLDTELSSSIRKAAGNI